MRKALLLALLVGGCGGDGSSSEPVVVHAARTKLAAVHDGTAWKALALDANGNAKVPVGGPTMIATVCDGAGFFDYYTIAVGPGDNAPLEMYCGETTPSASIDIVAPSTTQVFIGFHRARGGDSMTIEQGTYDIVAVDVSLRPARIDIQRDVALLGPLVIEYDLAATGTAMIASRIDVIGAAPGETPTRTVGLQTPRPGGVRTYATWDATTDAWLVPPSLLRPTDLHFVNATTSNELDVRSVRHDVTGTEPSTTLTMPPYITAATATFGPSPSVVWQGDARYDSLYFGILSPDFDRIWDISIQPSWIEAGGVPSKLEIPDPHGLPGWSSAWDLANANDFEWLLFAQHDDGADHISASRDGTF